jgi:hypothetical protein
MSTVHPGYHEASVLGQEYWLIIEVEDTHPETELRVLLRREGLQSSTLSHFLIENMPSIHSDWAEYGQSPPSLREPTLPTMLETEGVLTAKPEEYEYSPSPSAL